ncbi:MAG: NUDIX domain-containing protein [Acidobacteriota bacterium]
MTEQVMVVERERIASLLVERGLLVGGHADGLYEVILDAHFFMDRPAAEVSPQFKQIIPYVVIRHGASTFLLQRTPKQTEARLHHKLSIGIGGHVNPDTPDIMDGLLKELEEETYVAGDYDLTFAGVLNDDTTDVGSVHLGLVYLLDAHDSDVTIRETDKMTGRWASLAELTEARASMESWSEIVFDALLR